MKEISTATFTGSIYSGSASPGIGWQADLMDPGWLNGRIDVVRVNSMAPGGLSDPASLTENLNGNLRSDLGR
ncbi:MAG: hypothetical protein HYU36_17610 [Planctomycetes bacterium]|nr:hypothetical protein [Planctomycetota bacterium]